MALLARLGLRPAPPPVPQPALPREPHPASWLRQPLWQRRPRYPAGLPVVRVSGELPAEPALPAGGVRLGFPDHTSVDLPSDHPLAVELVAIADALLRPASGR